MPTDEDTDAAATPARSPTAGCGFTAFMAGVAAVAGAVLLLNRWETGGGLTRTAGIALAVLGTMLVLPFLLIQGLRLFMKLMLRRVAGNLSKMGEEMIANTREMYADVHTFRPATDDDFDNVYRPYYDETTRHLTGRQGFRHLGDVVDETIEEHSGMTTVIRVLASTDGTTMAGFYHYAPPQMPRGFEGRRLLMCDLAT